MARVDSVLIRQMVRREKQLLAKIAELEQKLVEKSAKIEVPDDRPCDCNKEGVA